MSRSLFSSKRRGLQKIRLMVSQPHGARHRDKTTEEKHRFPLLPGLLEWGDISSCLYEPHDSPSLRCYYYYCCCYDYFGCLQSSRGRERPQALLPIV